MNINEHPDFKITKAKAYCPQCDKETEFRRGLRLNAPESATPTYDECQVCGFDYNDQTNE